MAIDAGEAIVLSATFTDADDNPVDPTPPVEVTIKRPDDVTEGPFEASKQDVGVYEYQYTTEGPNEYQYKFESADGAVEQGTFVAKKDETT